ncbi:hypothetical protein LSG31_00465 [Fodinisporobacter ferrooxydans]|uniref:Bacterial CdiA-CT RNAse A domain-containing protein n=1 Tax=Fodinisporobacter ferrooxydans TaxID=2901836 RepID=A0ABY4CJU2_9BACL|nr:hypothetical protein LSG31_00465 [Alicyclobacillaceae bacterium MYW30-H2]
MFLIRPSPSIWNQIVVYNGRLLIKKRLPDVDPYLGEHWVTIHGNHVLISLDGTILSGRFRGQHIRDLHKIYGSSKRNRNKKGIKHDIMGAYSHLSPGGGLAYHEKQGGHMLKGHVNIGFKKLRERMKNDKGITAASKFKDRSTAERIVDSALQDHQIQNSINLWMKDKKRRTKLVLTFNYDGPDVIGWKIASHNSKPQKCSRVMLVLKKKGNDKFILTGYPI